MGTDDVSYIYLRREIFEMDELSLHADQGVGLCISSTTVPEKCQPSVFDRGVGMRLQSRVANVVATLTAQLSPTPTLDPWPLDQLYYF